MTDLQLPVSTTETALPQTREADVIEGDVPTSSNLSDTASNISRLLLEGTQESVDALAEIERDAATKEIRKQARRALYLLSNRGLRPAAAVSAPPAAEPRSRATETLHAIGSAVDGAGNRLFYLVLAGSSEAKPVAVRLLCNDLIGIRDMQIYREAFSELTKMSQYLLDSTELLMSSLSPDHVRNRIADYRERNRKQFTSTPAGFLDIVSRIGDPEHRPDTPAVYDGIDREALQADTEYPHEAAALFEAEWFAPWFLDIKDLGPWIERTTRLDTPEVVFGANLKEARKRAIVLDAAEKLLEGEMRAIYASRLEDTADVLLRRGETRVGRQALFHALQLRSDKPISAVEFAEVICNRTIVAGIEMLRMYEANAKRKESSAGGR